MPAGCRNQRRMTTMHYATASGTYWHGQVSSLLDDCKSVALHTGTCVQLCPHVVVTMCVSGVQPAFLVQFPVDVLQCAPAEPAAPSSAAESSQPPAAPAQSALPQASASSPAASGSTPTSVGMSYRYTQQEWCSIATFCTSSARCMHCFPHAGMIFLHDQLLAYRSAQL